MEIKKIQQKVNEKLGLEVEFDEEEATFLIEFAINNLLALGSAEYLRNPDGEVIYPEDEVVEDLTYSVAGNTTLN